MTAVRRPPLNGTNGPDGPYCLWIRRVQLTAIADGGYIMRYNYFDAYSAYFTLFYEVL